MQKRLMPINATQHASHGWKRYDHYGFAANDAMTPLLLAELAVALPFYPMVFTPCPGGGAQLVALLGMHAGENLFVNGTGKWRVGYVPSTYRGYPFSLVKAKTDEGVEGVRMALCFDIGSDLYREEPDTGKGEERFYDDDGTMGKVLSQVVDFLSQSATNRLVTFRAGEALRKAGLLIPFELPLKNPDPSKPMLSDLYCVDEEKLHKLKGEALDQVHKAHGLSLANAQLFSTARLGMLGKLYALSRQEQQTASQKMATSSLDDVFKLNDDEVFSFDSL